MRAQYDMTFLLIFIHFVTLWTKNPYLDRYIHTGFSTRNTPDIPDIWYVFAEYLENIDYRLDFYFNQPHQNYEILEYNFSHWFAWQFLEMSFLGTWMVLDWGENSGLYLLISQHWALYWSILVHKTFIFLDRPFFCTFNGYIV